MKRYGEKELRNALVNGATIRDNDWFTANAGFRVMVDGEEAGYIVSDLFSKLFRAGEIEKSGYGYSWREYAASDTMMEEAAEKSPCGLAACIQHIKMERDVLHQEPAEILARLFCNRENISLMFDAFYRVFPEWPISYETAREYWAVAYASDDSDPERIAHCIRLFLADLEPQEEPQEPQEEPEPEPVEEPVEEPAEPEETRQEKTDRENRDHCKRIAEDVEAYAEGRVYKCPNCGEYVQDNVLFCDCGEQVDLVEGDWEQMSLYDYFSDCLDIEYRVGSDKEYRSVRIMVAFGGPNIYIDTASKAVELYWWTDRAEYPLSYDVCDAIDEWAQEYWECL